MSMYKHISKLQSRIAKRSNEITELEAECQNTKKNIAFFELRGLEEDVEDLRSLLKDYRLILKEHHINQKLDKVILKDLQYTHFRGQLPLPTQTVVKDLAYKIVNALELQVNLQ